MPLQIHQLTSSEGPLLRELRLAALRDAPDQLGETLDVALARSEQSWNDAAPATYMALLDGEAVAMVYAFRDPSEQSIARLAGMWVAPSARRGGVGLALVHAVRSWAVANAASRVRLWVVPGTPAERVYRSAGFVTTGTQKPFSERDARVVIELELAFEPLP